MVQNKKKKHIGIKIGVVVLLTAMNAAVIMILLSHTPQAYQPAAAPMSGEVSQYLTHTLGPEFFNQVQLDKPFELVIEQKGANEILASLQDTASWGAMTFSSPAVVFNFDAIILMVTIGGENISSVLSVVSEPVLDKSERLSLNIRSVTLGAIPVTALARKIARQYADQCLSAETDREIIPIVNSILNNQPFEPTLTISKYTVRLKKFTLEPGKLILLIEPIRDKRGISGPRIP